MSFRILSLRFLALILTVVSLTGCGIAVPALLLARSGDVPVSVYVNGSLERTQYRFGLGILCGNKGIGSPGLQESQVSLPDGEEGCAIRPGELVVGDIGYYANGEGFSDTSEGSEAIYGSCSVNNCFLVRIEKQLPAKLNGPAEVRIGVYPM